MKPEFNQPKIQPLLDEFKDAYTGLEIGEFTESVALDAIANGTARIIAAHNNKLNEQLDNDNVKSKTLRLIHIHRFYGDVYRLNRALENLKEVINKNNK